jgi:hypothetical protein
MLWWNILGWASTLLSESLSATLLFIWLATFLQVSRKRTIPWILLHGSITILFSFTRDSWPYVLILFYGLYLLAALKWDRSLWKVCSVMLLFSVILFYAQQQTAKVGKRYRLPVMNNIVFRVLPYPKYVAWFESQGMPDAARLKEKYGGPASVNPIEIYPLYNDPEFAQFSSWVAEKGNSVYARFLLTHPECLLLLRENGQQIRRILAYNFGYIGTAQGVSVQFEEFFPLSPLLILLLLALFVFVSYREQSQTWMFPAILLVVFAFNSLLLYVADSMEVERHEYITMTMVQFLGVLALSFLCDTNLGSNALDRIRKRIKRQFPSDKEEAARAQVKYSTYVKETFVGTFVGTLVRLYRNSFLRAGRLSQNPAGRLLCQSKTPFRWHNDRAPHGPFHTTGL